MYFVWWETSPGIGCCCSLFSSFQIIITIQKKALICGEWWLWCTCEPLWWVLIYTLQQYHIWRNCAYNCGGAMYYVDDWLHWLCRHEHVLLWNSLYSDWQRPNCCGVHICDNCMLSLSLDSAIYWWEWPRNSRFTEWAILKLKLLTLQWSICTVRKISQMTRITAFNQQTATLWLNCVSIVMRVHQLANVKKICCYCFFPPVFNIVSTCV